MKQHEGLVRLQEEERAQVGREGKGRGGEGRKRRRKQLKREDGAENAGREHEIHRGR